MCLFCAIATLTNACGRSETKQPDLAQQPDRWVNTVALDADTKATHVDKTRDYVITTVTEGKKLGALPTVRIGDQVDGLNIGAIKCSFFWRDASYGGEQFTWRGKWGCMAGRSREEVENAVGTDGEKRFDYIYLSPVRLDGE